MIPRIKRYAWSLGLTVGLGFTFVPSGCGSVQPVADMPVSLAGPIRACAVPHEHHFEASNPTVKYDVEFNNGHVDSILLVESTLGDEELETCIASSIRSLTLDDLPLRSAENGDQELATPQSRELLGNPAVPIAACLASPPCLLALVVVMGATVITVQIMLHAATTTAKPTAIPFPTATPVPTTTAPPIATPTTTTTSPPIPIALPRRCLPTIACASSSS